MIRKKLMKTTAVILASVLFFSTLQPNLYVQAEETIAESQTQAKEPASQAQTQTQVQTQTTETYANERIDNNYTIVSSQYTYPVYTGQTLEYPISEIHTSGGALTGDTYGYEKGSQVLKAEIGDEVTLTLNAPQAGVYYINFDYLAYDESILPVELSMMVNGTFQYYELRRQLFESLWVAKEEKSYDRYGNEIISIPDKLYIWQNKFVMDASYRYSDALGVQLEAGENTFTLKIAEGDILFGNLYLSAQPQIEEYTKSETASGNSIIEIQAEEFTYRNDSSIRAVCEYDPDLYPYEVKNKTLNTIDSTSFKDGGQTITYEFLAETSGYYYLAFNYRQTDKGDFPVFMNIAVDGKIPNTAFQNYGFAYDKDYNMLTLTDNLGEKLSVYLEEGVHTISLTISMDAIRSALEQVDRIMSEVNDLSLEITKVVGTNKDKYRDFKLETYIPGIGDTLTAWANELDGIMENAKVYNKGVKKIAAFSSLSIASGQLRSLAKKPDELLYRIAELSTSRNSVNQYLANLTDSLNKNNFALDSIYLYQEGAKDELPKPVGFFRSIWLSIVRFFQSFTQQAYSTSNTDPEHLQVWVNRSRQHLEIMQKMIDEDFTKKTGIEVDLSLMPDQNKLVLANASGDSPDIATGINYSIPFELGIRGAIKDLTEFEDFTEIIGRYSEGLLVPATIGEGIYAMPETMNFWVLFYRSDILGKLGLEVPNTIEDVKGILTDLQMRGLNFYYPTAGMVAKTFHGTTPLLFQYGASLYGISAGDTTINSEEAVKGFTELTNLFTIYNLPKDVPSFYQHFRNGDYPIGIADFGTYNLISNAAPEIASSWEIALIPGVENKDGEILRYSSAGAESTVMFSSNEEREEKAWEFMKWWSSKEVQAEYGQTLQITYGSEYYWNTANAEAFAELPWRSKDKKVILEQLTWAMEAPRILGTYMLERELSNAYNSVVVDGNSIRITLDNAVKRINRETERKLEEFGYMENGKVVKEYEVPTIETVRRILGKTSQNE